MTTSTTPDSGSSAVGGGGGRAIFIAIVAAVAGFLFGFDSAVINGAVDALAGHTAGFGLDDAFKGLVVAITLIGSAIGAAFAGPLADSRGRLIVMFSAAVLFFVSSIGSAFAFTEWDFALWRFIGGAGIGIASVIGPTYISEIAPAQLRGRLTSLQQMAIVLGIFVALLSDAFIANTNGGADAEGWFGLHAWRWMFLVGVVPSLMYGLLSLTIPESPTFLVKQGKDKKAIQVLMDVLGEPRKAVEGRIQAIRDTLAKDRDVSFRDVLAPKTGLKPIVWVGVIIAALQQLVGINVIFYYSTSLWASVGFDESQAFVTSVITSVINVVATLIAIAFVDRVGRRPLLLIGSCGMALSLALMAVCFTRATFVPGADGAEVLSLPQPWATIALVGANAFVVFFAFSWGPIMWVLLGEMFPNTYRGYAIAVATAVNWIANFVVTVTFPSLQSFSLVLAYGLYAGFAAISFFFVLAFIPETKGRELSDMGDGARARPKGPKGSKGSKAARA